MQNIDKLKNEGADFLKTGYADLPDLAKMNVNAYMRGLKEGMALAFAQQAEKAIKHSNA